MAAPAKVRTLASAPVDLARPSKRTAFSAYIINKFQNINKREWILDISGYFKIRWHLH